MDKIQEAFEKAIKNRPSKEAVKFSLAYQGVNMPKAEDFYNGFKSADLLPTEKACPVCEGNRRKIRIQTHYDTDILYGNKIIEYCKNCTTGTIPIYYTTEQYEKIKDKPYPDDGPVWLDWGDHWELTTNRKNYAEGLLRVIANEAGKPPPDYRVDNISNETSGLFEDLGKALNPKPSQEGE